MSSPTPTQPPAPAVYSTYPDLHSRIALITGIGQVGSPTSTTWGNGAATARLLAHNGVKIFGCDLHLSAAQRSQSRLQTEFPNLDIEVMAADVTQTTDVEAFVNAAVAKHGRVDILINNVGMTAPGSPSTMSEDFGTRRSI